MRQRKNLRVVYSAAEIGARVQALGKEITAAYADTAEELLCVCVLRGAVMFFARLMQAIDRDNTVLDFMTLSSYDGARSSCGTVALVKELNERIEGRHVLIVEDIIDTGRTVGCLRAFFKDKGALSVRVAVLLDKPDGRETAETADFVAFTLDSDRFVVGFGLDDNQYYRQLDAVYEVVE